ncbi:MAG: tRNA-(ms[2]io[6]A)-hydroxylase [Pseudomonadales bacterium]|nr:tRNA-(ms[2]io[6]A)-hydroxylase [Pseudomonadales bacterium]
MSHPLKVDSSELWLERVMDNFDDFLIDHANNEKKASAVALSLMAHYPDKPKLLETMMDLALEELHHYRQVLKIILSRKITPTADEKDAYVNKIIKRVRRGTEFYFLDRLLTAAIIEARGAERFSLLANRLESPELSEFYSELAISEQNHYLLFLELAQHYFSQTQIDQRWQEWLNIEAEIISNLPIRARLH